MGKAYTRGNTQSGRALYTDKQEQQPLDGSTGQIPGEKGRGLGLPRANRRRQRLPTKHPPLRLRRLDTRGSQSTPIPKMGFRLDVHRRVKTLPTTGEWNRLRPLHHSIDRPDGTRMQPPAQFLYTSHIGNKEHKAHNRTLDLEPEDAPARRVATSTRPALPPNRTQRKTEAATTKQRNKEETETPRQRDRNRVGRTAEPRERMAPYPTRREQDHQQEAHGEIGSDARPVAHRDQPTLPAPGEETPAASETGGSTRDLNSRYREEKLPSTSVTTAVSVGYGFPESPGPASLAETPTFAPLLLGNPLDNTKDRAAIRSASESPN